MFRVGKSCLVERADKGYVRHHGNPTINASFLVKTVTLSSGERVQLEIWDTGAHYPHSALAARRSCVWLQLLAIAAPARTRHSPHTYDRTLYTCAAGQEKYKSLSRLYYRGARGCLLVYDVSNRQSFAEYQLHLHRHTRVRG